MKRLLLAAILVVFLISCQHSFSGKPHTGHDNSAIPPGYGKVLVNFSLGPDRTVLPFQELTIFKYINISINGQETDGSNDHNATFFPEEDDLCSFALIPGTYNISAEAFFTRQGSDEGILIAEGSNTFTVSEGESSFVDIKLYFFDQGESTGILELKFWLYDNYEPLDMSDYLIEEIPDMFYIEDFTLYNLNTEEYFPYTIDVEAALQETDDSAYYYIFVEPIPSGFYLLQARILYFDEDNQFLGYNFVTDVIHIGDNLASRNEYYLDVSNDFSSASFYVTNTMNDGPGSLRYAIDNATSGVHTIIKILLEPGSEIELDAPILILTSMNLTIEGNGAVITNNQNITITSPLGLMNINNGATITMRRIHFKGGETSMSGGAVTINSTTLTLESCIFSENFAADYGGAIYNGINSELYVYGCTFYRNSSGNNGGAIASIDAHSTIIAGNIFSDNTANGDPSVYYEESIDVEYEGYFNYNTVDVTTEQNSGWPIPIGNNQNNYVVLDSKLLFSPKSFRLLQNTYNFQTYKWNEKKFTWDGDYAVKDFYGNPVNADTLIYPGAVQKDPIEGFYLDLSVNDSERAGLKVIKPDENNDSVYSGSVEIAAYLKIDIHCEAPAWWQLAYNDLSGDSWEEITVPDGLSCSIALGIHTAIRAVFNNLIVDVFNDANVPGTFLHALRNSIENDTISFGSDDAPVIPGITSITIDSELPDIDKSLVIKGNGITLKAGSSLATGNNLLNIRFSPYESETTISRVYFDVSGKADIRAVTCSDTVLNLESCIFSNVNKTGNGGAIIIDFNANVTIKGCTFYNNTATSGGAIYSNDLSNTLKLVGNLFYGNTATTSRPILGGSLAENSTAFNAVDVSFGTGTTQCGWAGSDNDIFISSLPIVTEIFAPLNESSEIYIIPMEDLADLEYPVYDFYGNVIMQEGKTHAAAGAVQTALISD